MTVKRLEYLLILFGVFVFHMFFVDYLSFCLLAFFLALPVVSLILALLTKRELQVSIENGAGGSVKKKEPFVVRIHLRGAPRFGGMRVHLGISVTNTLLETAQTETLAFVMWKKEQILSYSLSSEHCGQIQVKVCRADVFDFLWLFRISGKWKEIKEDPVLVMPEIRSLSLIVGNQSQADFESDEYSSVKPGDDPAEIFDIRSYREGDKISRIHWKLSSKRNELMIKEGGFPVNSRILLVFDTARQTGAGMPVDTLAETVASVSWFLVQNGISHKLGWWQGGQDGHFMTLPVDEEADFSVMLMALLTAGRPSGRAQLLEGCLEEKNVSRMFYFTVGLTDGERQLLENSMDSSRLSIFTSEQLEEALYGFEI